MDMDAFYASVEQWDNPDLKGKPVIVGGMSHRGVVSAASYEARKLGVHSAMPIFQAKQKCPDDIYVPVRIARYREVSNEIMHILAAFSPLIEQVSIDEAYMDLSGGNKLLGSPREIGLQIKRGIKEATTLTCSIGIAPNKFLAKIASDLEKPDGLTIIYPKDIPQFTKNLPIKKVPGVGQKTVATLHKMGVYLLADVQRIGEHMLLEKTGKFGKRLWALAKGIDDSPVVPFTESKSISSEETFSVNTDDRDILKEYLLSQSEFVGRRARAKGLRGATVTLKLKQADFIQLTRSVTLEEPTNSSNSIYEQGLKLLERIKTRTKFRLIGLALSNLVPAEELSTQMNLFQRVDLKEKSWEEAEKAMDTIKEKFGKDAIRRGGL